MEFTLNIFNFRSTENVIELKLEDALIGLKFKIAEVYQNNRQRSWASYQLSHHNQWAFPPIQFDV